jgi:choline dehydrogenase-like flavoprotein
MDVSYLPKAHAAGAKAYTHARVRDIVTDPKTGEARGVLAEAVTRNGKRTGYNVAIRAPRVVLAAGTFHTPQLLKRNKIAFGNRHVGKHLTLHPATKMFAEFDEEIRGWEGTPQAYYSEELHDDGIMFEGIFTPPEMAGLTIPFTGKKLVDFMKRYAHMASFGLMIADDTEGRLIKLPFFGYTYYYNLSPTDVRRFQKGVAFLARAFFSGGAKRVYPIVRGWEFHSIGDVARFEAAKISSADFDCMAFHPLGTCRMSSSPKDGVVNQNHEVHGHPGLYICDGSVIPTALGVNPQLTIMAFATRFAQRLLASQPAPATV